SALNSGRRVLIALGLSERRAGRAASLFREQDAAIWRRLAPIAGEEDRYVLASRDSRETTERVLRAEMERIAREEEGEEAAAARAALDAERQAAEAAGEAPAPDDLEARKERV
ncbi:MAG: hypothetical protein JSS35_15180, partial [Proteobacteria bacterium]|nr:hypothetical protein [Pseudomonadota bacterium]